MNHKLNIVINGNIGCGKSTLLNKLALDEKMRLYTNQ